MSNISPSLDNSRVQQQYSQLRSICITKSNVNTMEENKGVDFEVENIKVIDNRQVSSKITENINGISSLGNMGSECVLLKMNYIIENFKYRIFWLNIRIIALIIILIFKCRAINRDILGGMSV